MTKTITKEQKYAKSLENKELTKVCVVVPISNRDDIMTYAAALRSTNKAK